MTPLKTSGQIEQMWAVFHPHDTFELRYIWPKGIERPNDHPPSALERFQRAKYKSVDEYKKDIEARAKLINDAGYNVYAVMNPIKAAAKSDAATDADIAYRDLILIDIDRKTSTENPATDAEVEQARQLADKIDAYLQSQGWPPAIKVMSGNGCHLYFLLEAEPNTEATRDAIKEFLRALAQAFDTAQMKVDTSVYNASRITKVPGTIMRKGADSADRPYRRAQVL